jgi:hypothetical protein
MIKMVRLPTTEEPVNASLQESSQISSSNDTALLLPDTPLATPKADLLHYMDYGNTLVSVIERWDADSTLTVGIFGDWGSGKTTLLNLMRDELERRNTQSIWVDVWKYGNEEDVWAAFLQALLHMVKRKMPWYRRLLFHVGLLGWQVNWEEVPRRAFELLGRIAIVVVPLYLSLSNLLLSDQPVQSPAGTAAAGAGTFLSGILAWYLVVQPYVQEIKKRVRVDLTQLIRTSPLKDRVSVLDDFRTFFEAMVASCVGRKGRLVVFVDDLDRCPPERIVDVLDSLKLFLDTPRCVYVMGLDRDIIEQAIRTKFEGYGDPIAESREYLEKIIGLPFDIPPLSRDQMEALVSRLDINLPDPERSRKVFALGQEPNPRKVKRTINVFLVLWELAKSGKRLGLEDKVACRLAKIVVIQHTYRDLYGVLTKRPKCLVELELYFRRSEAVEGSAKEADTDTEQSLPQDQDYLEPFIGNERLKSLLTLHSAHNEENQKANFTIWRHGKYELLPNIEREIEGYIELTRTVPLLAPESPVEGDLKVSTGSEFVGRQQELKHLDKAWIDPDINIISLVAQGGMGKTVLINEWLNKAPDQFLDYDKLFIWSFTSEDASDSFVEDALRFFGDDYPEKGHARQKGERLAELIRECQKPLLILDGLEPLQYPTGRDKGKLRNEAVGALLLELARVNPGLCIISTRLAIADLTPFEGEGKPCHRIELQGGLSAEAGAELLRSQGVKGSEEELESTSRDFEGHPLALTLLGAYLRRRYEGDVRKRDEVNALLNEEESAGKHARRVMASYEELFEGRPELAVLRLLGLFDVPVNEDYFREFIQSGPISGITDAREDFDVWEWRRVINNLSSSNLITRKEDREQPEVWKLDTHPLIRGYFRDRLQQSREAWREGNDRLYELYKSKVEGRPTTAKEADLLFQAMIHGCNAGRYQEALHQVYLPLIMGGEDEAYAENDLGIPVSALLSALSHFFEEDRDKHTQWNKPVQQLSEGDKLLVLADAGRYLTQTRGGASPEVGE